MKLDRKKIIALYTSAKKNHNLLHYLQNRFSAQLYCDENLFCFVFLIKQLGSSIPK